MNETLILFEKWCKANNWTIERNDANVIFPERITQRYPMAAKCDYFQFLNFFEKCLSDNKQSWFMCEQEYNKESTETEFGWNDMELMSLTSTEDDADEYEQIQTWWDNYLPILFSTRDGYSHFSISVHEDSLGQIVEGYEPIFEDTIIVANSLAEFLEKIMNNEIVF